ncbi:MAG: S8 family serine peptidase [Xanthomonadaceae bacterium]|jgi:serine protease|nr:S8 family serine peptidase [Xanthomonadaceae bacterium]
MKKKWISAAVTAAMVMASTGFSQAMAADAPMIVRQSSAAASTLDALNSNRLVIKYNTGRLAANNLTAKLNVVTTAASRANLMQMNTVAAAQGAAAPLTAERLRVTALGHDVIRLSRHLTRAEQDKLLAQLKVDPSVASVSFSYRIRRIGDPLKIDIKSPVTAPQAAAPNDPHFAAYQWHFRATDGGLNLLPAWDYSTGEGVVVAVIDTGILPQHPDMPVNVLEGYDFISDAAVSGRGTDDRVPGGIDIGDWVVADECGPGEPAEDSSWHGTHVAGTIAQATNNGIGGVGMAYNAAILPLRALGHCGGWEDDITDAIVWASGGHVDGVPDNRNPADVINLSLGGGGACSQREFYQSSIDAAVANGSVVVVAAGNENVNAANTSPSSCDNVIVVGSNRITGGRASYSNYGAAVDISAPGGGGYDDRGNGGWDGYVVQLGYDGRTTNDSGNPTYMGMAGTSMAAPHVAGTVALIQSALAMAGKTPLTPAEMEALLKRTARPFPVSIPANTPIGAGIVNPKAALEKALEEPCEGDGCGPRAIVLTNKVDVMVAGAAGSETLYRFEAEADKTLSIMTLGGTGDVSMYASFGQVPTASAYDVKSARPGNNETIRFAPARAGTYYIRLVGTAGYANVTLAARQ